jgi:hypothetical protein
MPNVKNHHSNAESFVLFAAIDIVETMLDESYAKELQKISLADDTVRRKV